MNDMTTSTTANASASGAASRSPRKKVAKKATARATSAKKAVAKKTVVRKASAKKVGRPAGAKNKVASKPTGTRQQARSVLKRRATRKNDGGNGTYYDVPIKRPLLAKKPYTATCADIITALGMTHAEGEAFSAIWRNAAARQGNVKPGTDAIYNAQKVSFYGKQMEKAAG